MLSFLNTSYSFLNAKISAMKSKMLTKEDYESLVSLDTIDEMIDRLEKSYYREAIQGLSVYLSGSELVESSSYKWVVSTYKKLVPYLQGEDRKLADVFLNRHEIRNLKVLLSAKIRNKEWEEVEPLIFPIHDIVDYRRFFDSEFKGMLKTIDLGRELLSLKLSTLWKGKEELMNSLIKEKRHDILVLSSLELYYSYYLDNYLKPHRNISPVKFLLLEQDVKNISLILRFIDQGKSEADLMQNLLNGGTLPTYSLLRAFSDENYRNKLVKSFGADPSDDAFKVEFDMYLNIARKKRAFRYKILSLDKILGFFMYIESEAEVLRLIARAKEMNIEKSSVLELIL